MSDDEISIRKDSSKAILLTKDGQRYIVGDGRDVITLVPVESAELMELDDGDEESDALEALDALDASELRDGAVSPEELNDDEASEGDGAAPKHCTYDGCTETTTQVAKQRKPWMCKKHRNKMYKDKYKKKKSDQAMSTHKMEMGGNEKAQVQALAHLSPAPVQSPRSGPSVRRGPRPSSTEGSHPRENNGSHLSCLPFGLQDNCEERPVSVNKQRLGVMGDRPVRPSLIEQVLNQKRLSLLRSPEVIRFLQQQQNILAAQSRGLALQRNLSGC
ncbi:regulatory factor X-associated protein isoform X1 [Stigmatopora nigra]